MKARLTRFFPFSASRTEGLTVLGHNYTLGVTVEASTPVEEAPLIRKVEDSLLSHVKSRDLSEGVEFLRGKETDDISLLREFWQRLEPAVKPLTLVRLSLAREGRMVELETE